MASNEVSSASIDLFITVTKNLKNESQNYLDLQFFLIAISLMMIFIFIFILRRKKLLRKFHIT